MKLELLLWMFRCGGVRVNGESDHDREIPVAECLINFFFVVVVT